jgi:hypothetical protein
MIKPNEISIILTATIDVRGVANMQRADIPTRLADYCRALTCWLNDSWVHNIVIVENSGYPLTDLIALSRQHRSGKNVEFLSFDGQDFPRSLGKGYGETLALRYVLHESKQLATTKKFLKVNGRYYVPNIANVLSYMTPSTGVFCNLTKSLTYSDSRVFGGNIEFLAYVCQQGLLVDDSRGIWLEHALSKAALHAIADGMTWKFIQHLPVVEGFSGTMNHVYAEPWIRRRLKGLGHSLKQHLLAL